MSPAYYRIPYVVHFRTVFLTSDGLVTLLRLHIQATLGSDLIGTIGQVDMESLYAQMFEGGLSARTMWASSGLLCFCLRCGQSQQWVVDDLHLSPVASSTIVGAIIVTC